MNPSTLGWYAPLLGRDGAGGGGAEGLYAQFRRDLPDEAYVGRLVYRGLVMRACGRLRVLDGVEVTEKERRKANQVLARVGKGRSRVTENA